MVLCNQQCISHLNSTLLCQCCKTTSSVLMPAVKLYDVMLYCASRLLAMTVTKKSKRYMHFLPSGPTHLIAALLQQQLTLQPVTFNSTIGSTVCSSDLQGACGAELHVHLAPSAALGKVTSNCLAQVQWQAQAGVSLSDYLTLEVGSGSISNMQIHHNH
jgi:hypothetical protein